MPDLTRHFVLDVEADGPHPVEYSMISFGLVSVHDTRVGYLGEVAPVHAHSGMEEARRVTGVSWEDHLSHREPAIVMQEAVAWIRGLVPKGSVVFWSDNPAFDWQWWNAYVWQYTGGNPAGFSARRIGDLYCGTQGFLRNSGEWKSMRVTPHTHNPVDDARGNAEALRQIIEQERL